MSKLTQDLDSDQGLSNFGVLVVDDESVIRDELAERFEKKRVKVYRARSGKQALNYVQRFPIGVVVLDIKMQDDGIEAAAQIQANHPDIRIVFLTGFDSPIFRNRTVAAQIRVERWIDKGPGSLDKAVSYVIEILERSRFSPVRQVVLQWARQQQIEYEKVESLMRTLESAIAPLPNFAPIDPPKELTSTQPAAIAPKERLSLEEVLYRLKNDFDEVHTGYLDVARRDRAWRQFRQAVREQLWPACEPMDDNYRRQLADQLGVAIEKIESHQLSPAHLEVVQRSLGLLSSDRIGEDDVHECEKAWRKGHVDTLPSMSKILAQWEELYRVEDE